MMFCIVIICWSVINCQHTCLFQHYLFIISFLPWLITSGVKRFGYIIVVLFWFTPLYSSMDEREQTKKSPEQKKLKVTNCFLSTVRAFVWAEIFSGYIIASFENFILILVRILCNVFLIKIATLTN